MIEASLRTRMQGRNGPCRPDDPHIVYFSYLPIIRRQGVDTVRGVKVNRGNLTLNMAFLTRSDLINPFWNRLLISPALLVAELRQAISMLLLVEVLVGFLEWSGRRLESWWRRRRVRIRKGRWMRVCRRVVVVVIVVIVGIEN